MNLILLSALLLHVCITSAASEPEATPTRPQRVCKNEFHDPFEIDGRKYYCNLHDQSEDPESSRASGMKLEEKKSSALHVRTGDAMDDAESDKHKSGLRLAGIRYATARRRSRAERWFIAFKNYMYQVFYRMGLNEGTYHQSHLDSFGRACKTNVYRESDRWHMCMDIRARTCEDLHVSDTVINECARQTFAQIKNRGLEGEFWTEPCWRCPLGNATSNAPTLFLRIARRKTEYPRSWGISVACGIQCGYYHLAAELDGMTVADAHAADR